MQEIAITQLPRVNLRLRTEPNTEHTPLFSSQRAYNISQLNSRKTNATRELQEVIINFRKKRNINRLKEHFNNKRSVSTINERQYQKEGSFREPIAAPTFLLNKQNPNKIEPFKWQNFKRRRITVADIDIRTNRQITDNKFIKRMLPMLQLSKKDCNKGYNMGSLPIIITIPGRSSQSPPPMSRQYHQIMQKKLVRNKKSLINLSQAIMASKNEKNAEKGIKDYKIQGWNIQQLKCSYDRLF